jgi:hypothetical protein
VQLATTVTDGELPPDDGTLLVARGLPDGDLGGQRIVATLIWSCSAITSSVLPADANSNARARRTVRTGAVRFHASSSSPFRSSSVSATRYRFTTIPSSTENQDHGFCLPVTSSVAEY